MSRAHTEPGTALYVYGVVDGALPTTETTVGDAVVSLLSVGPVAALVGRVSLEEFAEGPVRALLDDPSWLARTARTHEAVLSAAMRQGAVVPFRMLTVVEDEDELRRFLAARGADLRAVLDRVRGKVEIGVKAFVDRAALDRTVGADSPEVRELDAAIAAAASGRAYLLRRRRDDVVRAASTNRGLELGAAAHARLSAVAEAGVANPMQSREASGHGEEMVLNGAYLVPADDDRLDQELDSLRKGHRADGVTFERTGPWPAYNFVPRELTQG